MQSNTGSNQNTQSQNVVLPQPQAIKPQPRDILKELKDADNPLDFIKNNLRAPEHDINPQQLADSVAKSRDPNAPQIAPAPPEPPKVPVISTDFTGAAAIDTVIGGAIEESKVEAPPATEEVKKDVLPETPTVTDTTKIDDTDLLLSDEEVPAVAENFKKVRTKLKETNKTLKQIQEDKLKLEQELEEYKTGAVIPEILNEKESRIQELEKYEKLHNFKASKEYKELYAKPLDQVQGRLKEIAIDYDIPADVLNQALTIGKESDLNRFLSEHFDQLGAQEVKGLVLKARQIHQSIQEAEKEPVKALEALQQQHQALDQERQVQRKTNISTKAKDAWVASLTRIKKEGLAIELIADPENSDHNEKYVKPLLTKAATEYGKIVKMLADRGLEDLPKELAEALATAVLYGHATPVAITTRNEALKHAKELDQNTKRNTGYERPQIGGSSPGSAPLKGGSPGSPKEAAEHLLSKVLPATR